jgi:hypothetical protein
MSAKALLSASVSAPPAVYVEDVFSTYLYTGNGSTQTITNDIDLAGEGGLVWIKQRDLGRDHVLYDTSRGASNALTTNSTAAQATGFGGVSAFSSTGFTLNNFASEANALNGTYASWTFRKAEKFFDVVTYTGNGGTQQNIPHNLGSSPNCIIVKRTDAAGDWYVAPMMLSNWNNDYLVLNSTAAKVSSSDIWQGTSGKSSTTFGVRDGSTVNISGATYVAYLFAHGAGGFGLSESDNVISCGSYTGTSGASSPVVNLGYEPQWILIKRATGGTGEWLLFDNMRGMPVGGIDRTLRAETGGAEDGAADFLSPTATGFIVDPTLNQFINESGTYIYIAIRRGPMKVPTDGTKVFAVDTDGSTLNNGVAFTSGWPVDYALLKEGSNSTDGWYAMSRLQGNGNYLQTNNDNAEASGITYGTFDHNTGWFSTTNASYSWMFRRAPGFFDEVAYTGNGGSSTFAHNLGVVPEMMWGKCRDVGYSWITYQVDVGATYNIPFTIQAAGVLNKWNNTAPTDSVFSVNGAELNQNTKKYVVYLFATLAGVSKVGSYTGTGTTLNVDCGFTAGARFVLIKRTDSTGDWYVWDTARGIIAGNDPYLLLNSAAAEVTNTDYIDPLSSGFQISSTAPAAINASGGTYIFLAIA